VGYDEHTADVEYIHYTDSLVQWWSPYNMDRPYLALDIEG
jgi:hypothetical protein